MEDNEERCARRQREASGRERENRTRLRAVLPTEQRGRERENGRWTERELRVLSEQCRISLEKATPKGESCAFVHLWEGRPPRALALVSRTCGCLSGKSYFKSILDEESKPVRWRLFTRMRQLTYSSLFKAPLSFLVYNYMCNTTNAPKCAPSLLL